MKRCYVKPDGTWIPTELFWYDHLSSGDEAFDSEHVNVYADPNGKQRIMKCHISQITPINLTS